MKSNQERQKQWIDVTNIQEQDIDEWKTYENIQKENAEREQMRKDAWMSFVRASAMELKTRMDSVRSVGGVNFV